MKRAWRGIVPFKSLFLKIISIGESAKTPHRIVVCEMGETFPLAARRS
jgi:hypothetical protein